MRISVLAYLDPEEDGPDGVVDQVASALREKGHEVSVVGAYDDLPRLVADLQASRPELVFNLMEMFGENVRGDVAVAGVLELLGVPFTGGGPGELYLQQDKALAKKVLRFEGISYPDFAVFYQDADLETAGKLRMPLFVKPMRADASIGIDGKALVRDSTALLERVLHIHRDVRDAALAEEYVEGREFYVAIVGNRDLQAFPPIEMDFSAMQEGRPRVLDAQAKWDKRSDAWHAAKPKVAELPDELRAKLQKVSLDAYRALKVRDYGRVDLRLTESNEIFVIEVNANPYLAKEDEVATAAAAAGLDYTELVSRIAELAIERHRLENGHGRAARGDADPGPRSDDRGDAPAADPG